MPSRTRHNSSSSGGSRKSTNKPARSKGTENSSQTAPRSFAEAFGEPESPELKRLRELERRSKTRLAELEATGTPRLALHRTRHVQKLSKERKLLRDIQEAIQAETGADLRTATAATTDGLRKALGGKTD